MQFKRYLYILLSLLYLDLIFNLVAYNNYLFTSIINIILFDIINAFVIFIFTGLFKKKTNEISTYIIYGILWLWYSLHYVFYKVFITPFSIALFRQTDQTLKFFRTVVILVLQKTHILLLFIIPLIILFIFRKKVNIPKLEVRKVYLYVALFLVSIGIYIGNIFIQDKGFGSIYNLYYETNNTSLNIENLGVMGATYLDIKRIIFGFNDKIKKVKQEKTDGEYNYEDVDFDKGNSKIINEFMKNETGTKKNEYSGIFKGKNLVFIVAESFSEIAVSKEYTPTLYKLVHEGFEFNNFYTSNNLSTIGGEFQALTGLYADNEIFSSWRGGWAYYPYGMGNLFKIEGYNVHAYHDSDVYFQDRNVYLGNLGFDNFKGCNNGLEEKINCEMWPKSDTQMINATVDDYINSDIPFMTYYMTVSGHFFYSFRENAIARKNKDLVKDLDYPEDVKGYLATQIELDRAVEILMNKLEEANKLDDTVIVLLADHYPYNLPIKHINMLSSYERDSLIEANSNNLIIYNSKMGTRKIDKVGMSIDVLPTVLNLFGIPYDSRLIMGKDILSDTEGIAIFKDKSWVTNKGTYHASLRKFDAYQVDVSTEYVDRINAIVNNRVAISKMIVDNNYYKSVK